MENYTIVHANEGIDLYKDAIMGLWKNNLPHVPPERFNWLYTQNPGGPALTWLAVGRNTNEVVGIGSLYPRKMLVDGREFVIGVAVDFAIDKHHRVLGPALKIQRAIISGSHRRGFPFNYAYPNRSSRAVFNRVGYRAVGEVKKCIKLLKIERKVAEYIRVGLIAKLAASLVDKYFYLKDAWRLLGCSGEFAVEVLERCDGRFDALWNGQKARYRVMGEKSAAFLNWRYTGSGDGLHHFFCLFTRDRRQLKGFVVYTLKDDIATVKDIFSDASGDVLDYLVLKFSEKMRRENVCFITLSYFGNEGLMERLRELNFLERKARRGFFIFYDDPCDPSITSVILDRNNWSLFGGDLDL